MGNWMTVMIEGEIPADEVGPLTDWLQGPRFDGGSLDDPEWERVGPLTISGGLAGLGAWPAETVMRIGNCYERDYTPESVADQLRAAMAVAPGMDLKVHCGGDYESSDVIASVLARGGEVGVGEPSRARLPDIPQEQIEANLMKALTKGVDR
jgi:hypothetical protein